jgi:hypothetical protein
MPTYEPPLSSAALSSALKKLCQNQKPDTALTCRCREGRQRQPFWVASTAEVAILAFLHIRRQISSNPATLVVKNAAFLKLFYSSLAPFDGGGMVWVFDVTLTLRSWQWNRLHLTVF